MYNKSCTAKQWLTKYRIWRGIEVVITRRSWKPFVRKGAWVRIPPSPLAFAYKQKRTLITEYWKTLKDSMRIIRLRNRATNIFEYSKNLKTVNSVNAEWTKKSQVFLGRLNFLTWEFDPGSGWTLAACLTHASRTDLMESLLEIKLVADGWVTRG